MSENELRGVATAVPPGDLAGSTRAGDSDGLAPGAARTASAGESDGLAAAPGGATEVLSFAEERFWFLQALDPSTAAYNVHLLFRLSGPLSCSALETSVDRLLARHDVLRSQYRCGADGVPCREIGASAPCRLEVEDVAGAGGLDRVRVRALELGRKPFDLERGPLCRFQLFRAAAELHYLLMVSHHIAFDEGSVPILQRELAAGYDADGDALEAAVPPVSYGDFARWQRDWLASDALAERLGYWSDALAGAPFLQLPMIEGSRPRTSKADLLEVRVPAEVTGRLRTLAREERTTLFAVLAAGLCTVLARYTGERDVVIGTVVSNRSWDELDGVIGLFLNTIALRVDLGEAPSFREVVRRAARSLRGAVTNADVPFDKVVEAVRAPRSPGRNPLFEVALTFEAEPAAAAARGGLVLDWERLEIDNATFDLTVAARDAGDELSLAWNWRAELLPRASVEDLALGLLRLLTWAVARPDACITALEAVEPPPTTPIGEVAPRAARDDAGPLLHDRFRAVAAAAPQAIAVVDGDRSLTYGELDAASDRLAAALRTAGATPDGCVAIALERSAELIVALLGVLKAGAAYLPLDPREPHARLGRAARDAAAAVLVTRRDADPIDGLAHLAVVAVDAVHPEAAPAVSPALTPDALAYVMFTSGSTGAPRGVAVPHRAVLRLVLEQRYARFAADETVLHVAPPAFDAATFEIWSALLHGGRLVIAPPGPLALHELAGLVTGERITTLWLTTGLFHELVDAHPEALRGVRQLLTGGDVVSPAHARTALAAMPGGALIHAYGPTEATTFTSCHPVAPADTELARLPIGAPLLGTRVHVLDDDLRPVPRGASGELFIAGDGLARGYVGRGGATAERFLPDPSGPPGARMYRTGDRARERHDRTIDFLGRVDRQVKLRGYRVEPGEVEAALRSHPQVRDAAVTVEIGTGGDACLAGHVVARVEGVDPAELRGFLSRALPSYLVPSAIAVVPELPLTSNGKIDRALLSSQLAARQAPAGPGRPRTPTEDILAAIWQEVFPAASAGLTDDFFDLGGHSLLATRLVARVRAALGARISLREFFAAPTIEALARRIDLPDGVASETGAAAGEPSRATADERTPPAPRVTAARAAPRRRRHPLSFVQERFWFMDQVDPGKPWFNLPIYLRLRGALDADALERAIETVVQRHEPLRTQVVVEHGEPRQVVAPDGAPVERVALDAAGLSRRAQQELDRPFDLVRELPFRAVIVRLAPDDHALLATAHHIAVDGWSLPLLEDELGAAYAALATGRSVALPELALRYTDFAEWQREPAAEHAMAEGLAYWTAQLATAPVPAELPTDHRRGAAPGGRARLRSYLVPAALRDAAAELARREGATLFMVLLAAFKVLVHRTSGATDVVIGSPIAGRTQPELERMVGCFINTVALRTDLSGRPSFRALVQRVRDTALGAYDHQDVPLERVMHATAASRDTGRESLFRLLFALAPPSADELAWDGLAVSRVALPEGDDGGDGDNHTPGWDLGIHWGESAAGLGASVVYSVALFEPETVDRAMRHLEQLLAAALAAPDRPIDELDYLAPDERRALVAPPPAPGPGELLHALVGVHAARAPGRIAASGAGGSLSYGELWARSGALADALRGRGLAAEDRVAVYLDPCPERVVAMLAILRAGGAFVALDPAYRSERLSFVIDDARAQTIVTCRRLRDELPAALRPRALCLDEPAPPAPAPHPAPSIDPDQLAYVLYTSGSTGVPKAAALSHRAICEQLRWSEAFFAIGADDAVLHICSIGFDVAIMEVFAPLVCGARLAIGGAELGRDVAGLARFLCDEQVTISVGLIQPLLQALVGSPAFDACRSLRHVVQGGEALQPATRDEFLRRSRAILHNAYGATEIAIDGTCKSFGPADAGKPVSIGREIAGLRVYLLDDRLHPVPIGVTGEIYFAGGKLARGYWDRPALTAEAFLPDPFTDRPGGRMYRTGDLARRRGGGELEFLGRRDGQVKIRGFRVELGDIEATLALHPDVRQARAIKTDADQLAAYVVAAPGCTPEALRELLRARLPPYMVPAGIHLLDALPTLPSGKLDVRALPQHPVGFASGPSAPLSDAEQRLAALWRDQLGCDQVARDDDFFDLGGHSLLLLGLQAAMLEAFGRDVSIVALIAAPSLRAMAALLAEAAAPPAAVEPAGAVARRDAMRSRRRRGHDEDGHGRD